MMTPQEKTDRLLALVAEAEKERNNVERIGDQAKIDMMPHMERLRQIKEEVNEMSLAKP